MFLNSPLFCVISTVQWSGATSICDGIILHDKYCAKILGGIIVEVHVKDQVCEHRLLCDVVVVNLEMVVWQVADVSDWGQVPVTCIQEHVVKLTYTNVCITSIESRYKTTRVPKQLPKKTKIFYMQIKKMWFVNLWTPGSPRQIVVPVWLEVPEFLSMIENVEPDWMGFVLSMNEPRLYANALFRAQAVRTPKINCSGITSCQMGNAMLGIGRQR